MPGTVLGCEKCRALFAHDGCVKDPWPPVCPKCGNGRDFQAWAGKPEWEKEQREEWAKQASHSQPARLEAWMQKTEQERFFFGSLTIADKPWPIPG